MHPITKHTVVRFEYVLYVIFIYTVDASISTSEPEGEPEGENTGEPEAEGTGEPEGEGEPEPEAHLVCNGTITVDSYTLMTYMVDATDVTFKIEGPWVAGDYLAVGFSNTRSMVSLHFIACE